MTLRVEFVTLGVASEILGVPAPTLRNWTDQLETFDVHYVIRNNRNERVYFEEDIEIFKYVRDLKSEYGRKTTTRDIARMLVEDERFKLRSETTIPKVNDDRVAILKQEDIQQLMESDRVQQFMKVIVDQTTKNLKDELKKELVKELEESIVKNLDKQTEDYKQIQEDTVKIVGNMLNENNELILKRLDTHKNKKGFWNKLLGKS